MMEFTPVTDNHTGYYSDEIHNPTVHKLMEYFVTSRLNEALPEAYY
jgi:hypothetical protein